MIQQGELFDSPSESRSNGGERVHSTIPTKQNYSFNDFVAIFCGDRKLAMHWYLKHNPPKQGE